MHISESKIRVRYAETDQMGIVYHANYYVWFEVGRGDYMRQYGMSYKEMEALGIIMPVIECRCKYKAPAKYDDLITVRTSMKSVGAVRACFDYQIIRDEDGELLAEGETVHAFVNKDKRPINLKKKNKELFDKILSISGVEED